MKTKTKKTIKEKGRPTLPFTEEQNEAIRMIVAEQMNAMIEHQEPIPLLMAQRYLERIVPQIVERIINVEVDRVGIVRDIKRDLEGKGEQIMEARTEQVRQRVNDWMDKDMRRHASVASKEIEEDAAKLFRNCAENLRRDIQQWMPTWWTNRAWKWLCKLVRRG